MRNSTAGAYAGVAEAVDARVSKTRSFGSVSSSLTARTSRLTMAGAFASRFRQNGPALGSVSDARTTFGWPCSLPGPATSFVMPVCGRPRVWTPPLMQAFLLTSRGMRLGASVCPASRCGMRAPRARVWTPPLMQAFLLTSRGMRSGASVCPASRCGMRAPRARVEVRGSGPNRTSVLERTPAMTGFPDPVSSTVCPYPSSDLPTSPQASRTSPPAQAAAGSR